MFQTQGYPVPPPQYFPPDFQTPPHTPASARQQYYSPRQFHFTSSPSTDKPHHSRRATQDYGYSYSTPKKPTYYSSTAEYASSPGYHSSTQPSSQRKTDYVSDHHRAFGDGHKKPRRSGQQYYNTSRSFYQYYDEQDRDYEYLPRYEAFPPRPPPPYNGYQSYYGRPTDHAPQVPVYGPAEPTPQSRPRRASYTAKQTYTSRPRPSTAPKQSRRATEEDVRKHQIPAGYSYKNWDPTEEPILLLGSVFDANSLGKWIYDWTVFYHGPATPMSDLAGDLWLLLIQLAGKVKSAEDALPSVRQQKNRDMIDDFLDSGERLWQKFNKLLKICENYMWKAAKRECGDAERVTMGKTSGCEFVDSIFGRDRELERTERLMTGIRLWALRYTANVDPILTNPAA